MKVGEQFLPKVIKKWKSEKRKELIRLTFTGSFFEVQVGDDQKGYQTLDDKTALQAVGYALMTSLEEIKDGRYSYWEPKATGDLSYITAKSE